MALMFGALFTLVRPILNRNKEKGINNDQDDDQDDNNRPIQPPPVL